ncbi:36073_t:CDS:2, partial [Gigaspora margarita]
MAIVDCYAGLFKLRVFKNQYAIEFLLPTSKRCREYERFARRIVDNINDTTTQLIEMSPNNATKLEQVYSKTIDPIWFSSLHKIQRIVVRKNSPMPVLYYLDESEPRCPFVREQLMHVKEEPMLPP